MQRGYRVIIQTLENKKIVNESVIIDDKIKSPTNCVDFTMGLEKQLKLIGDVQSIVLDEKLKCLTDEDQHCTQCKNKMSQHGKQKSVFHDVLSDHRVTFNRMKCRGCGYESPCTARSFFGTIQSGELQKIQSELGSQHSFREAEEILKKFSSQKRTINNHDRIKQVTESVGQSYTDITQEEKKLITATESKELILNVDGGHVKTIEEGRSVEAMTSVIYSPSSIKENPQGTRRYLSSKNCAASVKKDNQEEIICGTIVAALKQGMTENTHVTALCDGAKNCWNVADSLKPLCREMTYILDWFHVSMKMENIALSSTLKSKFLRIKWHLWRGNTDAAIIRLQQLKALTKQNKYAAKIEKFHDYIVNNKDKIIDYRKHKKDGRVFTSNLAESTVETLINQRCKGKQHMKWSRDGLNPVLQMRAALHSKGEWENKWKMAILNAA